MQALFDAGCKPAYDQDMTMGRPPKRERCEFGRRLYEIRQERGLSQKYVAAALGITQQSYALWERRPVALRPDQLRQLAGILGVSADHLLDLGPPQPRKGGPSGKARLLFEEVSRLPRHQQNKVAEFVEGFLSLQKTRASNNG
jgi:transcriptional regulator with XRE-family HTH domain